MGKLTNQRILNWMKAGNPVAMADGDGLTFTLSAKGTASWILRYRFGSKGRELTLGRSPDISLSDARKLATEYRARIQQGADVARDKRRTRTDAVLAQSFRQLAEDYMEKFSRIWQRIPWMHGHVTLRRSPSRESGCWLRGRLRRLI